MQAALRYLISGAILLLPLFISAQVPPGANLAVGQFAVTFREGVLISSVLVKNVSGRELELSGRISVEKPGAASRRGGVMVVSSPSVIWVEETRKFSVLRPGEEKRLEFSFFLSAHLPRETYSVIFEALSPLGESLGGLTTRLDMGGDGRFLELNQENCQILKTIGGKEFSFHPQEAGWFEAGESPRAVCKVKNNSREKISAQLAILTNEFSVFGYYLSEPEIARGLSYDFSPGETKTITISLPQKSRPQVYESVIQFTEPQNPANRFSALIPLRWTVKGAGARLVSWSLDKRLSYGIGERLELTIKYYGSPDVFWDDELLPPELRISGSELKEAKLLAEVKDEKGERCGGVEKNLPKVASLDLQSEKISLAIGRCQNPQISVKIVQAGEVLSEANLDVPVSGGKTSRAGILIGGVIILLVIVLVGWKVIKRRSYAGV